MRRRAAPRRPDSPTGAEMTSTFGDGIPARPWHETRMVRLILVALVLVAAMHAFLWKVVYDFWMAENHDRLRQTARDAADSLYRVIEHL